MKITKMCFNGGMHLISSIEWVPKIIQNDFTHLFTLSLGVDPFLINDKTISSAA